jgi:hypothetical protein
MKLNEESRLNGARVSAPGGEGGSAFENLLSLRRPAILARSLETLTIKSMDIKSTILTLLVVASLAVFAGCKDKSVTEKAADSMEKAADKTGDAIKTGAEKTGEAVEKAYDKTKEAVKDGAEAVKDGAEKTGDAIKNATK